VLQFPGNSFTGFFACTMLTLIRGAVVKSIKEHMVEIIQRQPEDSSFDEIMRELAFTQMVDRGLDDSAEGRTISNEEMQAKIQKWRT
jgi:predicted transcriptional regulator